MPGAQDSKDKQTDMVTGHYTATFMPKHVEAYVYYFVPFLSWELILF